MAIVSKISTFRRTKIPLYFQLSLLCILLMAMHTAYARENKTINVNPEAEISIEVFPATDPHRSLIFIWQSHEKGLQAADYELAEALSKLGIEVWVLDLLQAYFLSNTPSNMNQLNGDGFKSLISEALKTNKTVIIAGSSRGNVPVLRGARDWQLANKDHSRFAGVISVSPKLYVKTPDPGTLANLLPIVEASNLNHYIMQPNKSPSFWQLNQLIETLRKSGSTVYLKPLQGIRDRFYFRHDALALEQKAGDQLAKHINNGINILTMTTPTYRQPKLTLARVATSDKKKQRGLEKYQGNPSPRPLILPRLEGGRFNLKSLQGKVVLVNFWASWCPPCVQEMPSMERLNKQLSGKPFTLLGVNMAETKPEVESFLNTKVTINFPIVMDYDGKVLKSWRVFAFPTSYVLDKQGKIRYALFGSVEWDNPDIVSKIQQLIAE